MWGGTSWCLCVLIGVMQEGLAQGRRDDLWTRLSSDVCSSYMSQYLCIMQGFCLCVAGHPLCGSLVTVENTRQHLVSLCSCASLVLLKPLWTTCRSKEILYLCWRLDRASGNCISFSGLYLIMVSYCCKWRSIPFRWGGEEVLQGIHLQGLVVSLYIERVSIEVCVEVCSQAQMMTSNSHLMFAYWVLVSVRDLMVNAVACHVIFKQACRPCLLASASTVMWRSLW